MIWKKKGLIFNSNYQNDWMVSHAMLPFAKKIRNDIFRIYFSPRDISNRSHGAFIDVDFNNKYNIVNISQNPIISPGEIGLFDDSGAQPCCFVEHNNKQYLYYVGWSLCQSIPFRTFLGLAIKNDSDLLFKKYSSAPIMSWTKDEPYSIGWVFVLHHDNKFKMWYECNINWININNNYVHYFVIKYAESDDGINWNRFNKISIPIEEDENVVSRPSLIIENDIYKMWYSYKKNGFYRIGYAESLDGINWLRKDNEVGIDVSEDGWDSEQIEYPFVFNHKGERYMLYNGNGYGKSGFGLAQLIK
jgi:hypothetical protein